MNRKLVDAQSNCLKFSRGYALGEIMTPWGVRKIDELMPRNPFPKSAVWATHRREIERRMEQPKSVLSPMIAKRIISQMEKQE